MDGGIDAFALSFSDIPEDAQLCILSFLSPDEISRFSCTSRRFAALCRNDGKLWHAMCDRRWGKKTQIQKWGKGRIAYRLLYRTLHEWENLIGFWRRCGRANPAALSPPLIFFEWGPSFVLGSRVTPTRNGTYHVTKTPFLRMGLSSEGRIMNFLDLDGNPGFVSNIEDLGFSSGNFVQVDVNFMGNCHFIVEENRCFAYPPRGGSNSPISKGSSSGDESEDTNTGKSPDFMVSEMYAQFANRASPGSGRRRQRRKEKERQNRIKWEAEHFVKVVDCSPTTAKPLQGLWKGFCNGSNLEFYYVKYDEVGGIICRKVGELSSSRHTVPVFWTSTHSFNDAPISLEEEEIFNSRMHNTPLTAEDYEKVVSRVLHMNSSYDLIFPDLDGDVSGPGRIWLYENGTFGFGFLRDQFIIDLKRVVEDDCLIDGFEASNH